MLFECEEVLFFSFFFFFKFKVERGGGGGGHNVSMGGREGERGG